MDVRDLRSDYTYGSLTESDIDPDPFKQFAGWLEAALSTDLIEPHGMTVSTVGENGRPSSRVVLLRGYSHQGLVFYTNYQSRKGRELGANPWACINFWWPNLQRQIRIEGKVERVEAEMSDAYFASRPYDSQVASAASPQSQVIASRAVLDGRIAELKTKHPHTMPRPEHWGGFCLKPDYFEFWQGRKSRLHDRLTYVLEADGSWKIQRLAP